MMDFAPAPGAPFAAAFDAFISDAIKRKHEADDAAYQASNPEAARPAIGVGRLGNECLRAIAFQYHRVPRDPGREPSGKLYRIFDRGHEAEKKMAEYLRLAGFTLITQRQDGKQIRFDQAKYEDTGKGRIKGMIDGVITDGPAFIIANGGHHQMHYPCSWEMKELGAKGYAKYSKKGLKAVGGDYWAQAQLNMAYLELGHCLFTVKNADTQEIYAELVPFDAAEAQRFSDRAVNVIQTKSPFEMPRIAKERTDFRCKFCDYADTCWSAGEAAPAGPAPTWMAPA